MLACDERKVGGLNLLQLVDCLHWGHHSPEGKNIYLNTSPKRTVVLMFILYGGHHGPEGKNICINTAPRRAVVLMFILPGGHHGPEGKNICLNTAPRTVVLISILGGITALRAKTFVLILR